MGRTEAIYLLGVAEGIAQSTDSLHHSDWSLGACTALRIPASYPG